MQNIIEIICPVSGQKADKNITRTTALLTILIVTAALLTGSYLILLLLAADFAIRSFSSGTGSPLKILSKKITDTLNIDKKLIDAAPKKFAAMLGMAFSFLAAIFMILNLPVAATVVAVALMFCALLEGAFGYCLGCVVYTFLTASPGRES